MSECKFEVIVHDEEFLKGRTLIELPFNVWKVFGVKGVIAVKAIINEEEFKFNLVPRGNGKYAFFLTSAMKKKLKLKQGDLMNISIDALNNEVESSSEKNSHKEVFKIQNLVC